MNPRPSFTVAAAARATGVSRRSISRLLETGKLEGATKTTAGVWSIPTEALLAAGLTLHAPEPPPNTAENTSNASNPALSAADEVTVLRAELNEWKHRAQLAEALATERAATLDDLRTALELAQRALPPAPVEPPANPATSTPPTPNRLARWWPLSKRNKKG